MSTLCKFIQMCLLSLTSVEVVQLIEFSAVFAVVTSSSSLFAFVTPRVPIHTNH